MRKWKQEELTAEQKAALHHTYHLYRLVGEKSNNYYAQQIRYVREITEFEGERLFLNKAGRVEGAVIQEMYKLKGDFNPIHVNLALRNFMEQEDAMRLNYISVGGTLTAVVWAERKELPEIIYRNVLNMDEEEIEATLRKAMAADLRQEIDLQHGCLASFSVFRTASDEYAIIVTVAQAILDELDIRNIFRCMAGWPRKEVTGHRALDAGMAGISASIQQYWQNLLQGVPLLPRLPHSLQADEESEIGELGKASSYLSYIPDVLLSDLWTRAKENRRMLMAILQTAWGFLLHMANNGRDVAYCLLVPPRAPNATNSMIPVRLHVEGNQTAQELVDGAFRQFVVSQPYASLGRKAIWEIMEQAGGSVNHFLDFGELLTEVVPFANVKATPEGNLVARNVWDGRDIRLGIRFRQEEDRLAVSFQYDSKYYTKEGIAALSKEYLFLLQHLLTQWEMPYAAFAEYVRKQWAVKGAHMVTAAAQQQLQRILNQLPLLERCNPGGRQVFQRDAKLAFYFEGDRIHGSVLKEQLIYLVEGRVLRCIKTADGWYNMLDVKAKNSWLNEVDFLANEKTQGSVEILTDQALVLMIPRADVLGIIEKDPQWGQSLIQYMAEELGKFQRMWAQS